MKDVSRERCSCFFLILDVSLPAFLVLAIFVSFYSYTLCFENEMPRDISGRNVLTMFFSFACLWCATGKEEEKRATEKTTRRAGRRTRDGADAISAPQRPQRPQRLPTRPPTRALHGSLSTGRTAKILDERPGLRLLLSVKDLPDTGLNTGVLRA